MGEGGSEEGRERGEERGERERREGGRQGYKSLAWPHTVAMQMMDGVAWMAGFPG